MRPSQKASEERKWVIDAVNKYFDVIVEEEEEEDEELDEVSENESDDEDIESLSDFEYQESDDEIEESEEDDGKEEDKEWAKGLIWREGVIIYLDQLRQLSIMGRY